MCITLVPKYVNGIVKQGLPCIFDQYSMQLLENRQFEEDDHCCCSSFKYELFIKAGTRHVRTGPKKKKSRPGGGHVL